MPRCLPPLVLALALLPGSLPAQSSWLLGPSAEDAAPAQEAAPPGPTSPGPYAVDAPREAPFEPPPFPPELFNPALDQLGTSEHPVASKAARRSLRDGLRALEFGDGAGARRHLVAAHAQGMPRFRVEPELVQALLMLEEADAAAFHAVHALRHRFVDRFEVLVLLGKAHSLRDDPHMEIDAYTRAWELDPDSGEVHFLLALAYDKVDNSPKVLEHAQKAIRIDPEYKERLKVRIRDSNVSKKIGRIVTQLTRPSRARYERLSDEQIRRYADEIGRILGESAPAAGP